MNPSGKETRYPLHGVRILDMATVLAAPFSATLCGDMGADVVKLELPGGGDSLRDLTPVYEGQPVFWKTANRGKAGITLDVRKPAGRDVFLQLIRGFDVLVENFRAGTLERWGLDVATLHRHNPRLVVLRLTGFGQTGPYARRPGFARVFEAMSGFTHLTGEASGPPQHMNYPMGDVVAGLFGAFAISTALVERNAKPVEEQQGMEIDLSATDALMRLLDPLAAEFALTGEPRSRTGSRATYTAPSNVYQTADGVWLTLVGTGDAVFRRICTAIGEPSLPDDQRFTTNAARKLNLDILDAMISTWCKRLTFSEAENILEREDVPFTKIYSFADVAVDPHFRERQSFIELDDPVLGKIPAPNVVPRIVGRSAAPMRVGPDVGQDNDTIYRELGFSLQQIERLRADNVI